MLRLRLFGPVSVVVNEQVIDKFPTSRSLKLLVLLGRSRNGRMRREALADLLWPDDFYDATRIRLRQEIHRLKKCLGEAENVIQTTNDEVILDRTILQTDLDFLERVRLNPSPADASDTALTLPFLEGWDDSWAVESAAAAAETQRQAVLALGPVLIKQNRGSEALGLTQALITRFPLDERLRVLAVEAHASVGSLSSAVAEYQEYRARLKSKSSTAESQALEGRIQALVEGQAKPEPAPKAWSSIISAPIDRFVGRDQVLDSLAEDLAPSTSTRLVTLVGPGGIGKTRLSLEAARKLSPAFEESVAMIFLADLEPQADWSRSALEQIKCQAPAEGEALEVLSRVLNGPPTLMVLDNLEHLESDLAGQIRQLLETTPNLKILATSRTPLRLPGERIVTVGPLDPKLDGRILLLEALKSNRFGQQFEDDGSIDTLAETLAGYPLAIRLASARLRTLNPATLLEQIEQNPEFLRDSGSSGVQERHRSLSSALDGSFDALAPEDQEALALVASCPGGAGIALARFLLRQEDPIEVLERLVDSALVTVDDREAQVHFKMLVPVREYVLRRSPRADQGLAELTTAVEKLLEQFGLPPGNPIGLKSVASHDSEHENIRAAFVWASVNAPSRAVQLLHRFWLMDQARGRNVDLLASIEDLSFWLPSASPWEKAVVSLAKCGLKIGLNREPEAENDLAEAEVQAKLSGDKQLIAAALIQRCYWLFRRGHPTEAAVIEEAEKFFLENSNPCCLAKLRYVQAFRHHSVGRVDQTRRYLEESVRLARSVKDDIGASAAATYLASIVGEEGDRVAAKKMLDESRAATVQSRHAGRIGYMCEVEANLMLLDGRPVEAEQLYRKSLAQWQQAGSIAQIADQHISIAKCLVLQGVPLTAAEQLVISSKLWESIEDYTGLYETLLCTAQVLAVVGKVAEARQTLSFASKLRSERNLGAFTKFDDDYRSDVESFVGEFEPWPGETSYAAGMKLFDLLPRE